MEKEYDLLLSPHPDDIVFSAYSAITESETKKLAIIFFNISNFTRLRFVPKSLVTFVRTSEDYLILASLQVHSKHLFLEDTSIAHKAKARPEYLSNFVIHFCKPKGTPKRIFCPMGIGGHTDHLVVRRIATDVWMHWDRRPTLFFYEDLPYAKRCQNLDNEISIRRQEIEKICGSTTLHIFPMTPTGMQKKIFMSRAYLSQTDHSVEILDYARSLGRKFGCGFCERFYATQ